MLDHVCNATAPPIEQPTNAAVSTPRSSISAIASSTLEYRESGQDDFP